MMSNLELVSYPDPFSDGKFVNAVRSSNLDYPLFMRGKVRDVYKDGRYLLLFHTDRISAFDVVFDELIPYKGIYLAKLSAFWFKRSGDVFPNHFVESLDERTLKVVKAERINIEWIVRGFLYGSAWRAYAKGIRMISGVRLPNGLIYGEKLDEPILTPTFKSDAGHDAELTKEIAISEGLLSVDEWDELEEACFKLYSFYNSFAERVGLIIADVKFEFGRYDGELIQIDEAPTHDSARIWTKKYYRPGFSQERYCLDKEFFRAYLMRNGFMGFGVFPKIPFKIIQQVAWRVRGSYDVLSSHVTVEDLPLKDLDDVV